MPGFHSDKLVSVPYKNMKEPFFSFLPSCVLLPVWRISGSAFVYQLKEAQVPVKNGVARVDLAPGQGESRGFHGG